MKKGLFLLGLFAAVQVFSQPKPKKLGPALNSHSFNYWAPFVSLDGSSLLFLYDYTEDGEAALYLSVRQGGNWKEPLAVPKKLTGLSYTKAATLSPDGRTLFMTSQKGGLGGYDIMAANINGNAFSELMPLGAPINSPLNEGSPTTSPDGSTLFFMRCGKMNATSADECKIFMSKKDSRNLWGAPVELPAAINTGNSQMPRIMADGQTLLFASNRLTPNKGGHDVYLSKLINGQWSEPINLSVINTPADDLFFSASHQGLNVMRDWPGDSKKSELVEFAFPAELKPRTTTRVIGTLSGVTDPAKASVKLVDLANNTTLSNARPDAKGEFVTYVPEGGQYGLFVDPPIENMNFWTKVYDYTNGRIPLTDRIATNIKAIGPADEMVLDGVWFKPHSAELDARSVATLQRVAKLIWGNLALHFEIDVTLYGLQQDTIPNIDLTEIKPDTVVYEMEVQIDSVTTEMRDSLAIENTYHNDRTKKQGEAIANYLYKQAVKPDRITLTYHAVEEAIAEKRRTVVTLRVR